MEYGLSQTWVIVTVGEASAEPNRAGDFPICENRSMEREATRHKRSRPVQTLHDISMISMEFKCDEARPRVEEIA
jgi:hypothetical protein